MFVGDGTWDKSRNSFLLPNLQGLNFETMRYNGMGNRFKGLPQYHKIILGHGVLAAITFLGIVPLAIFLAKYGTDWPGGRVSFKLHVYLQILTVFLSTVILVLGWFAVGPERSLSNPHHGIGVAIYVLILAQFMYGSCMYRRERKRDAPPRKLPLPVYIHRLIGRSTALLAFAQIGLGLTLYGSPKLLFILYALAGFFLLTAYLVLDYYYKPGAHGPGRPQEPYSDYGDGSYVSGSRTDASPPRRKKESHWGRNLLAAGGALGAYEWWKKRRDKNRGENETEYSESEVSHHRPPRQSGPPPGGYGQQGGYPPSGPPPAGYNQGYPPGVPPPGGQQPYAYGPPPIGQQSYGPPRDMGGATAARNTRPGSHSRSSRQSWEDEKYSEPQQHTWRNRILGATGAFAAFEGAKSLFNRRKRRDSYSDDGEYRSALGGNRTAMSQTDVSRVEAGQAPSSPDTPRVNMGGIQPMTPSHTPSRGPRRQRQNGRMEPYDERGSFEDAPPPRPVGDGDETFRDLVGRLGPIAGAREWNRRRKLRKEADRAEDIRQQELENEENYNRRNSNRYPTAEDASRRRNSNSGTLMTGPSAPDRNMAEQQSGSNLRLDTSHPPLPADAGTFPSSSQHLSTSRQNLTNERGYSIPPPPPGPPPSGQRSDGYGPPQFGSAHMPEGAINPDPSRLLSDNTAANESSAYGRDLPVEDAAAESRENQSLSPTKAQGSRNRLPGGGSATSGSVSQLNSGVPGSSNPQNRDNPNSPPVSVKVTNDGNNWTFQRLNEQQAAQERAARRQQRRDRRRRGSSLSSGMEDEPPTGRYRRNGPMRSSNDQPITNVPPPPPMSSSAGQSQRRDSELNLPKPPSVPSHSISPHSNQGFSPPAAGGMDESGVGSPGYAGNETDVSNFADNRRRRRAERARQQAAARAAGPKVEFE